MFYECVDTCVEHKQCLPLDDGLPRLYDQVKFVWGLNWKHIVLTSPQKYERCSYKDDVDCGGRLCSENLPSGYDCGLEDNFTEADPDVGIPALALLFSFLGCELPGGIGRQIKAGWRQFCFWCGFTKVYFGLYIIYFYDSGRAGHFLSDPSPLIISVFQRESRSRTYKELYHLW